MSTRNATFKNTLSYLATVVVLYSINKQLTSVTFYEINVRQSLPLTSCLSVAPQTIVF